MIPQNPNGFEAELARSRVYELAFSRWLQVRGGYYTLPAFDFNGIIKKHAPSLSSSGEVLSVPDILTYREGKWTWFEVKLKECAPLHRKSNTYVTGLPLRNWQDYLRIREVTAAMVWIVFIHLKEQEIVTGEIGDMSTHNIDHKATMDNGGTVFFQYNKLHRLMSLERLTEYTPERDI